MKNLTKILLSVCILLISLILIVISASLFEFLPIEAYHWSVCLGSTYADNKIFKMPPLQ